MNIHQQIGKALFHLAAREKIRAQPRLFVIKLLLSNLESMNMRFLLGTELQHRPREVAFLTATCKCYPCQIQCVKVLVCFF